MNPFEQDNDYIQDTDTKESKINIWVEANGRKKNTYVTGWNISETNLKDHLKIIKKKHGCNGTVKSIPNEANNGFITVMQLQGDHTISVSGHLISNGVETNNIHIKG